MLWRNRRADAWVGKCPGIFRSSMNWKASTGWAGWPGPPSGIFSSFGSFWSFSASSRLPRPEDNSSDMLPIRGVDLKIWAQLLLAYPLATTNEMNPGEHGIYMCNMLSYRLKKGFVWFFSGEPRSCIFTYLSGVLFWIWVEMAWACQS